MQATQYLFQYRDILCRCSRFLSVSVYMLNLALVYDYVYGVRFLYFFFFFFICFLSLSLSHSILFILWMAFFSIYAPEVYRVCTVPAVANCYQEEIIWKGWIPFTFFLFINNILGQFK